MFSINNSASVLSTFRPGTAKVVRFRGAHRFYRAAGWDSTRGEMASAYGSWWADEMVLAEIGKKIDMFESWLPGHLLNKAWPAQYRGVTALCEDWNKKSHRRARRVRREIRTFNNHHDLCGLGDLCGELKKIREEINPVDFLDRSYID